MNHFVFVRVSLLIVLVAFLAGTSFGHGQSGGDDALNGLPKAQKDLYSKIIDLYLRDKQAGEIRNALAQKEVFEQVTADRKKLIASTNVMLAKEGVKGWIGEATVQSTSRGSSFFLRLEYNIKKRPGSSFITFTIPTDGMSPEVLDVVKKLSNGDRVQFNIAADEGKPAQISKPFGGYEVKVPSRLLVSLSIVE